MMDRSTDKNTEKRKENKKNVQGKTGGSICSCFGHHFA